MFKLVSKFEPAGDQKIAIPKLVEGIKNNERNQTLLGATGSGKTYTIANVIQETNLPTLVMAPNKILSAQLYEEFKHFFPENAVEYFVSYYDYYRPEAYIPHKGLYLEKESSINEIIDQMRHKATRSLIERKDVIIVASVSCIYGIGAYEAYSDAAFRLQVGDAISMADLTKKLITLAYEMSQDMSRGKIRVRGQTIWIGPAHIIDRAYRVNIDKNIIIAIEEIDPLTRKIYMEYSSVMIFPNSHHMTPEYSLSRAIEEIQQELKVYLPILRNAGKIAEAQRLEERTRYDIEQLKTNHSCSGIENYSRFFTQRKSGEHPPTLYEYFPRPFLLIVDESHITVPQIHGMASGDAARKGVLIDHGFRLPSSRDNRPMKFNEWDAIRPTTIFVSATPGVYERENSVIVEQIIRPTGLLDPVCNVRPTNNQIDDAMFEAKKIIARKGRVLMLTLTKKTSENLSEYLISKGMKVAYLHGDQTTLERIEKLYMFRKGEIDIIVGVNLLREGIDIPECELICIFEADQEGFLRTSSALIQMIGRAARNENGQVILYADKMTKSMKEALDETSRRRAMQDEYNKANGITPKTIKKDISEEFTPFLAKKEKLKPEWITLKEKERSKLIKQLDKQMKEHVQNMEFEEAALVRDQKKALMELELDAKLTQLLD